MIASGRPNGSTSLAPIVSTEALRPRDRVPAVESVHPAEVDPDATEQEDRRQHQPAHHSPQMPFDHPLHEDHRPEAEHEADSRKRRGEARIEPDRRSGDAADVDEVGDDVRRVGKEQEPGSGEARDEARSDLAPVAVVQHDREQERDPGQHQVPGEEAVLAPVWIPDPEREERKAHARCEHEREERCDATIGEGHAPIVDAATCPKAGPSSL